MSRGKPTWPRFTGLRWDGTHRLIPETYAAVNPPFLADLAANDQDLAPLESLAAATSGRTLAQNAMLPGGPTPYDLVFDVPYSKIINAAFSYPGNQGARFSLPRWGAWYAGRTLATAKAEAAYHRRRLLVDTLANEDQMTYVDFRADIRGTGFADLRDGSPRSRACLDPDSYAAGQALAQRLLTERAPGVVYPSVRAKDGECVACLLPHLVANVDVGGRYSFEWNGTRLAVAKLATLG